MRLSLHIYRPSSAACRFLEGGGGGGGGGLITIFTSGGVVWVMAVTVTFIRSTPAVNIKYLATWLICSVATPTLKKPFYLACNRLVSRSNRMCAQRKQLVKRRCIFLVIYFRYTN